MASKGTRKGAAEVAKVVKVSTAGASDNTVTTSSSALAGSKPVTRREVLIRQPSYCKILDDLKGTEAKVATFKQETTAAVETTATSMDVSTAAESSEESNETLTQQQVQTI